MVGSSVAARLKNLKSRVHQACRENARDPASVHILAVSKLHSLNSIRAAYDEGQRDFAENYVQEAIEKVEQLASLPVKWHFIGRIQSNKVKFLANRFAVIHSLDRATIAEHLNRLTVGSQDVFLQLNVASEASKGGVANENLDALFRFVVEECKNLRILGLMVMPPLDEPARPYFAQARVKLAELKASLSDTRHPLDQLSMGTSADFAQALAEGATWIRIGSEIFGAREEKE